MMGALMGTKRWSFWVVFGALFFIATPALAASVTLSTTSENTWTGAYSSSAGSSFFISGTVIGATTYQLQRGVDYSTTRTGTITGTTTLTLTKGTTAKLAVGHFVVDDGGNIPAGTTIASITNSTVLVLSAASTNSVGIGIKCFADVPDGTFTTSMAGVVVNDPAMTSWRMGVKTGNMGTSAVLTLGP